MAQGIRSCETTTKIMMIIRVILMNSRKIVKNSIDCVVVRAFNHLNSGIFPDSEMIAVSTISCCYCCHESDSCGGDDLSILLNLYPYYSVKALNSIDSLRNSGCYYCCFVGSVQESKRICLNAVIVGVIIVISQVSF